MKILYWGDSKGAVNAVFGNSKSQWQSGQKVLYVYVTSEKWRYP